jgi:tetratricopeptide (TPR) repeat protein
MAEGKRLSTEPANEAGFAPAPPWRRTELRLLDEAGEVLGLALWRALRDVRLWAESPAEDRSALFPPKVLPDGVRERNTIARAQAPEIAGALAVFEQLARGGAQMMTDQLANACVDVALWAETLGLLETAQQFAEAAAALDPTKPQHANIAGRIARVAVDYERAYQWYARAFSLARTRKHTDDYIRAHLGAGALFYHQGLYARARRHWTKGAQRAQSRNRRSPAAEAQHDLLTLEMEIGTYVQAEQHARAALQFYPLRHPQFPALGIDLSFLLVRYDLPHEALAILHEAGPLIVRPQVQVAYWGVLARAAARAGNRERMYEGYERVRLLSERYTEFAAAATMNVAEAAWLLREWDTAESCAARAADLARVRGDRTVSRDALALLDRVADRTEPPRGLRPPRAHQAFRLTSDLIRRLRMTRLLRERRESTEADAAAEPAD